MQILVTGSIAFDHIYTYRGSFLDGIDTSKLADLSVSFSVTNHRIYPGGAGANVAWNLSLLKQSVSLLSAAGKDGHEYNERMRTAGIDMNSVRISETGNTAHAIIVTDDSKRQITLFDPGVEEEIDWKDNLAKVGNINLTIVTPWRPIFMLPIIEWCRKQSVPFLFDPGQHILDFTRDELLDILPACRGLIVNAYEWQLLLTRTTLEEETVLQMVPFAVITRGEEGFEILEKTSRACFPACTHNRTYNPTGAGDAFRAGLVTGMVNGWPLALGCQLGAGLASVVVEHEETQLDAIDLGDIRERVLRAYDTTVPDLPQERH